MKRSLTSIEAGGGAYYFAKKSINADRAAKFEASEKRRQLTQSLEYSAVTPTSSSGRSSRGGNASSTGDTAGSPSQEATTGEPAPTRHAPESEGQRVMEKSKYEAAEPYRAKKGDRFS